MTCCVQSRAVFCNESIEYFPGMAFHCFFKPLFRLLHLLPVCSHISCPLSLYLYTHFILFSAFCCVTFLSAGMATAIIMHVFYSFFLIIIPGLFSTTTLCVTLHSMTLSHFHVHILAWLWVRAFQSFRCLVLCILNNANVHQTYRVSLATHSSSNVASWG